MKYKYVIYRSRKDNIQDVIEADNSASAYFSYMDKNPNLTLRQQELTNVVLFCRLNNKQKEKAQKIIDSKKREHTPI